MEVLIDPSGRKARDEHPASVHVLRNGERVQVLFYEWGGSRKGESTINGPIISSDSSPKSVVEMGGYDGSTGNGDTGEAAVKPTMWPLTSPAS